MPERLAYPTGDLEFGQKVQVTNLPRPELTILTVWQRPVVTAGAYAAQDAVGGMLTFSVEAEPNTGLYIDGGVLTDLAKQDVQLDLVLFNQEFTPTADNAAFDIGDADLPSVVGVVSFVSYTDSADSSFCAVRGLSIPVVIENQSGALYGQLVTRGAPTYATTTDVTVRLTFLRG